MLTRDAFISLSYLSIITSIINQQVCFLSSVSCFSKLAEPEEELGERTARQSGAQTVHVGLLGWKAVLDAEPSTCKVCPYLQAGSARAELDWGTLSWFPLQN